MSLVTLRAAVVPRLPSSRPPEGSAGRPSLLRRRGLLVQAAVVLAVLLSATGFVVANKTVSVSVDGATRQVHTFAGTVGDLLSEQGIAIGPHDLVSPATSSPLRDGERVVVRFGRQLRLLVDGQQKTVWTTATTVSAALGQLGPRFADAYLSTSRSMPLGRAGASVTVRTEKAVTFVADGKRVTVTTTAPTILEALAQAGLSLGPEDTMTANLADAPYPGEVVTVTRKSTGTSTQTEAIPFTTVRQYTSGLYVGQSRVSQAGRDGVRRLTFADTFTNGKRTAHVQTSSVVATQPVAQVVLVGTKQYGTIAAAAGLNWPALASCESGGNPRAVSPAGYYGLYQFSPRTWATVGGSGLPSDAAPSEQTYRAQLLFLRSGSGQWPLCGSLLFS